MYALFSNTYAIVTIIQHHWGEMAPHSSILVWKIPWSEEPGGLQSWGRKESDTTQRLSTFLVGQTGLQRQPTVRERALGLREFWAVV